MPPASDPFEITILTGRRGAHWWHQEFPQPIDYFRERGHIAKLHSPNEPCPLCSFLRIAGKLRRQRHGFPDWQELYLFA